MQRVQKLWNTYRKLATRYPLLRKVLSPIRFVYHYNYVSYLFHRARGLSYREWYALTLDNFARYTDPPPVEGLEDLLGRFQLDYLRKQGLKPEHSLLDFGCGYLRAGVHFIPYLNPGRYVGVDISQGRLLQGQKYIVQLGLEQRKAELILVSDLELKELPGRTFDFVWCYGVFGHMPLDDIEGFLKNIHLVMDENSVFLANYTESNRGNVQWVGYRHVFFRYRAFEQICTRYGLHCELMSDWHNELRDGKGEPHPLVARDQLLKITLSLAPVMAL